MAQKHYTLLARLATVARLSYASGGVNALELASAATGSGPTISAVGDDTNVDLNLAAKGSGSVRVGGNRVLTTADSASFDAAGAAAAVAATLTTHAAATAAHGISAFGATLVDDADASAARTTLGLGTLATQSGTFSGTSSGTNTGDQTITLTGGVTGSGTGSFAATVVTNANLTGPITSVGNATAIADAELAALAGLTSAANKLPRFTGSGTADLLDVSATAAATTVPISASDKRLADGFMRLREFGRRSAAWQHDIGATTISAHGTTATLSQVGTGTASSADTTSSPYEQQQTGTTTGNTAGRETSATVTQRSWHPILAAKILTGANIQNLGYWFGLSSATLAGVDTPTTQHVAAFRYNVTVDGTAFWRCITCDGATVTVTTTSTAIATSTVYRLRIELDDTNTEVRFYINDTLVATHGSANNPPGQTTQLGVVLDVTTKANAAKRFAWDFINLVQGLPF